MKYLRYLSLVITVFVIMLLQACGNETGGALSMTAPAKADNGDGTYTVSTKITYAPPAGKSAEGVELSMTVTDSFGGVVVLTPHTFTSGSNSFDLSFRVSQSGASNYVRISASIGSMNASGGVSIPATTALSAAQISFVAADAVAGTTKTTTIAGGVGPYSLVSATTYDGVLTMSLSASVLSVYYVSSTTLGPYTYQVTIQDANGNSLAIPVNYFK